MNGDMCGRRLASRTDYRERLHAFGGWSVDADPEQMIGAQYLGATPAMLSERTWAPATAAACGREVPNEWLSSGDPAENADFQAQVQSICKCCQIRGDLPGVRKFMLESAQAGVLRGLPVGQSPWEAPDEDFLRKAQRSMPALYNRVMMTWDHSKSDEWNRTSNLQWTGGMHLLRAKMEVPRFESRCGDDMSRAAVRTAVDGPDAEWAGAPGYVLKQGLGTSMRGQEGERNGHVLCIREVHGYGRRADDRPDAAQMQETMRGVIETLAPDGKWFGRRMTERDKEHLSRLLLETAAVETDFGQDVERGPAKSLFQLEEGGVPKATNQYKETMEWLARSKAADPELYGRVASLYDPSHDFTWNKRHNVPWTAAISLVHYEEMLAGYRQKGGLLTQNISSPDRRAHVWKAYYNTYKGAGTVNAYVQKANKYVTRPLANADMAEVQRIRAEVLGSALRHGGSGQRQEDGERLDFESELTPA